MASSQLPPNNPPRTPLARTGTFSSEQSVDSKIKSPSGFKPQASLLDDVEELPYHRAEIGRVDADSSQPWLKPDLSSHPPLTPSPRRRSVVAADQIPPMPDEHDEVLDLFTQPGATETAEVGQDEHSGRSPSVHSPIRPESLSESVAPRHRLGDTANKAKGMLARMLLGTPKLDSESTERAIDEKLKKLPLVDLMVEASAATKAARNISKYFMIAGIGISFVLFCTGNFWSPALLPAFLGAGAGVAYWMRNRINSQQIPAVEAFKVSMAAFLDHANPAELETTSMIEARKLSEFLDADFKSLVKIEVMGYKIDRDERIKKLQARAATKYPNTVDANLEDAANTSADQPEFLAPGHEKPASRQAELLVDLEDSNEPRKDTNEHA